MLSTIKSIRLILVLLFSNSFLSYSQLNKQNIPNNYENINSEKKVELNKTHFLTNTHREIQKENLPYYLHHYSIKNAAIPSIKLENVIVRELNSKELEDISAFKKHIPTSFDISYSSGKSGQENIVYAKIIPIRLNSSNNRYEFLESYLPVWDNQNPNDKLLDSKLHKNKKTSNVNASVLATGKWYKVGVTQSGIYKINKAFLSSLGLDVTNLDPKNIRVYGNGGKLLPEKNADFRNDDLLENAVTVVGENDGVFDNNDYILFYGQSTDSWKNISGSKMPFDHKIHYFSDTSFYFITADLGAGKRVPSINSLQNSPNTTTTTQDRKSVV